MVCVAPSVARSMPEVRLDDSTGAISARPSTRPACRAPIVTAPARTGGSPAGTAAPSSTSCTRSNPTPQIANAKAAATGAAPGTKASTTSPAASSKAPPMASAAPGAGCTTRPRSMPSGKALTSKADCSGSYRHTSIAMSTPRNSAATSAAKTSANPTLATVTSVREVVRTPSPAGSRPTRARSSAATANAPATIGAWKRKIARHENSSVNTPPSAGPIAAPTAAASAHHRRPRPGPGTNATSTGNEPASSSAAPTP